MKVNTRYLFVIYLSIMTMQGQAQHEKLDTMVEFGYPVSEIEAIRHDIAQGLCFLRQASVSQDSYEFMRALQALEHADDAYTTRTGISSDDRDVLQNLMDQINALISTLEDQDMRSNLSHIHDRLDHKL